MDTFGMYQSIYLGSPCGQSQPAGALKEMGHKRSLLQKAGPSEMGAIRLLFAAGILTGAKMLP